MDYRKTKIATISSLVTVALVVIVLLSTSLSVEFRNVILQSLQVLAIAFAAIATIIVATRLKQESPYRRVWAAIGLGLFLWLVGGMVVALHRAVGWLSFPLAGVFWMAGYAFLIFGVAKGQKALGNKPTGISITIATFAIAVFVVDFIVFLALPLISSDMSIFQKVLRLVLNIESVLLAILLIFTLLTLKYDGHSRTWILLTWGLALIAVANLAASYLQIQNIVITEVSSVLWLPGSLLIGTTSVHELEAQKDRPEEKKHLRIA